MSPASVAGPVRCPLLPTARTGRGDRNSTSHAAACSRLSCPHSHHQERHRNVLCRFYNRVFQALQYFPINAHFIQVQRQVSSASAPDAEREAGAPCSVSPDRSCHRAPWPNPSGSTPSSSAGLSRPRPWRVPVLTRGLFPAQPPPSCGPLLWSPLRSPRPPAPTVLPESTQSQHAPISLRGSSVARRQAPASSCSRAWYRNCPLS